MPESKTRADPATTFMKKWSWGKAAAVCLLVALFPILGRVLHWQAVAAPAAAISLLTVLLTFLSPDLGRLLKHIFGRRVHRRIRWLASIVDPDMSVTIGEFDGPRNKYMRRPSRAYQDVKAYLGDRCSRKARHLVAETDRSAADELELSMRNGEEVTDETEGGVTVWWSAFTTEITRDNFEAGYILYYQERHRDLVLDTYLRSVRREGRNLIRKSQRKIITNTSGNGWTSDMPFNHPKTFDTLAIDPRMKQEVIDDLEMFKNGRQYYKDLGKPWKRGYLLYGPPGTGKSTMVAAMANFLNYDVYDIELMSVKSNAELRKLFMGTKSKSIILIEDIDCSLDLTKARKDGDGEEEEDDDDDDHDDDGQEKKAGARSRRRSEVTLSGLLNFIDGLWSSCGEERIIVFTTNHVDKLDPALIRRGRMDKHIEMSYCGFEAFTLLAKLYLDVKSHPLFGAIEKLLREVQMTPADVAENLTLKSRDDDANSCLHGLVAELEKCRTKGKANGARIAGAVAQGATTEQGPRRSPRIKELRMPQ